MTVIDTIKRNFNRNSDRYTEGKHFYCLTGEKLKEFFANVNLTNTNIGKVCNAEFPERKFFLLPGAVKNLWATKGQRRTEYQNTEKTP